MCLQHAQTRPAASTPLQAPWTHSSIDAEMPGMDRQGGQTMKDGLESGGTSQTWVALLTLKYKDNSADSTAWTTILTCWGKCKVDPRLPSTHPLRSEPTSGAAQPAHCLPMGRNYQLMLCKHPLMDHLGHKAATASSKGSCMERRCTATDRGNDSCALPCQRRSGQAQAGRPC